MLQVILRQNLSVETEHHDLVARAAALQLSGLSTPQQENFILFYFYNARLLQKGKFENHCSHKFATAQSITC